MKFDIESNATPGKIDKISYSAHTKAIKFSVMTTGPVNLWGFNQNIQEVKLV